jgi:cyclophilin family peptidyl-prolyl cis-trans isomerase
MNPPSFLATCGRASALLGIAFSGALLVASCGGGGDDTPAPAALPAAPGSAPAVSTATSDRLSYGRVSTFTVDGSNLSNGASYAVTGCDNLTLQPGATATRQIFTCTPHALAMRLAVSSSGSEIFATALTVPKPRVGMTTTSGTLVVELEPGNAPITVDNFLAYVNSGYYNGTLFHRVVAGFVNQGGGFDAVAANTLTARPGLSPAIVLESNKGLSNTRGTIAMARTSVADSATSQFFFNQVNNSASLDFGSVPNPLGYAVFGGVVSGEAVLDAINAVATRTVGGFTNVPATDIFLQTAVQTQ